MAQGGDITLTAEQGMFVLSLLEDAEAALNYFPEVVLLVELRMAIELLTEKLFGWLPPGQDEG